MVISKNKYIKGMFYGIIATAIILPEAKRSGMDCHTIVYHGVIMV